MAALSLSILGSFQAVLGADPLPGFRTNKVQALLIYLASEPTAHRREMLMTMLWPGMPDRSARHNLRQVIYHLRNAIPEISTKDQESDELVPLLLTNRQTIQLNPVADVESDVSRLEALITATQIHDHLELLSCHVCRKDLEDAIALYKGDFVANFYLDDSNEFENWAQINREAYRRQVLDALEVLTTIHIRQQDYARARTYAERQLEIDNLRESAYRQQMEILALSGHREQALAVYEHCSRLLAEEFAMGPTTRTTKVYEKILAGDLSFEIPLAQGVRGYELKDEIGEGAFGAVHRAIQPAIGREVAVKVIRRKYANNPEFIRRFEAEAQTIASLEHPYIVPLYDYWRDPDGAYLVMRYLRGGSLLSALESGPWNPGPTVKMLDQVCSALSAAHHQGIIHRDIKPDNILLDEAGNAFLSDFGIAKDLGGKGQLTAAGAVIGTPDYISPEQILSETVSPQTDIYSLGAVLYETLTGEKPFPDASVANLIYKHLNEPVPLVSSSRPDLSPLIDNVIQRATAKRPADRYADTLEMADAFRGAVQGTDAAIAVIIPAAVPAVEVYNPYKGLRAFQEADADDFFGREVLVDQLVSRLTESRFLAVIGPSGSGKSSAVKAGLIPALRGGAILPRDNMAGSKKWFVVEMVPGTHPLDELELALWPVAVNPPPSLVEPMLRDTRGMLRTIRRILPNEEGAQLLLVIDQFEELFTLVDNEERRDFFLDSLLVALRAPRSPLRVVITLRADFYDRPLQEPSLGKLLKENTEIVLPLTPEELTWAVREPARRVGVGLEEDLVAVIVADVADQPGALPLLQYALTELFERRQDGLMNREVYEEIGGVLGALGRRANEIYDDLDSADQGAARQLFLRLVTLGEGVEDTRRRVLRSELEALQTSEVPEPSEVFPDIIEQYGAARLMTFDHDLVTRQPTVEVAHEALLREWGRLRGWLDESRDDLRQHRKLTVAAAEWVLADRNPGFLLRGTPLDQFEDWSQTTDLALTGDEQAYLEASLGERNVRQQEEAERQAHEAALEQRSRRFLRSLVGVFGVAAVIAIFLTIFAFGQRNSALESEEQANQSAATATFAQGEAVVQADLAATQALAAQEQRSLAEEQRAVAEKEALTRATAQADAEAQHVIAIEQRAVAEAEARAALEAYSQSLAAHVDSVLGDKDSATALALALEASLIDDPPALTQRMLRQAAYAPGPRQQFLVADTFPGVDGRVYSLAMSPHESEALIGFEDGTLILWNLSTKTEIHRLEGHDGLVRAVAFSPDGQTALSGSNDRKVILWDLETGQEIRRFEGHDGWVRTVAFSPDGETAVSGGFVGDSVNSVPNPGQLILWDLASGQEMRRFEGHPSGVVAAAFSPDGRAILASSGFFANVAHEYSLMLWDAESGEKIRDFEITGQSDHFSLAISPDGHTALTGTNMDEVILWDMDTGQRMLTLEGHTGNLVTSVVYTPDGRRALSGDANGLVILWDLVSGEPVMQTKVQEPRMGGWHAKDAAVLNLVIGPEGRTALSSAGDGTLVLWDLVNAGEIRRFAGHQTQAILGVAFTPDGKHVLTAEWGDAFGFGFGDSNNLRLWDVETGEEIRSFEGHTAGIIMIAVSTDGRQALTASQDGTLRLWDLETGEEIRQILAHTGGVYSVAFSPDGGMALSGSMADADDLDDSGITLWDLESGQVVYRLTDQGHYTTVLFNSDGQTAYAEAYSELANEENNELGQYDIETSQLVRRYSTPPCCTDFAIHPDGHSVFLANNLGGPVVEWDLEADREIRAFGQHPGSRTRVEVSPDGRLLLVSATNFEGGIMSLWDLETGQEIRRFSGDGICCVDIDMSPDGNMAITPAGSGTAILWDLNLPADMDDVRNWIDGNRYVRELSCEERELYRIEPLCEA